MASTTVTTDDSGFSELISSETPVLVDFWAEWCGPCKMMEGPLKELAGEQAGKLTIAKLNVDENPSTAMAYEVMSIPLQGWPGTEAVHRRQVEGSAPSRALQLHRMSPTPAVGPSL